MQLSLLILVVLGVGVAAVDRYAHRAAKHESERKAAVAQEAMQPDRSSAPVLPNIEPLKRCAINAETADPVCPPAYFCLFDDWRCILSKECEGGAGWCMPWSNKIPMSEDQVKTKKIRRDIVPQMFISANIDDEEYGDEGSGKFYL